MSRLYVKPSRLSGIIDSNLNGGLEERRRDYFFNTLRIRLLHIYLYMYVYIYTYTHTHIYLYIYQVGFTCIENSTVTDWGIEMFAG